MISKNPTPYNDQHSLPENYQSSVAYPFTLQDSVKSLPDAHDSVRQEVVFVKARLENAMAELANRLEAIEQDQLRVRVAEHDYSVLGGNMKSIANKDFTTKREENSYGASDHVQL